MRSVIMVIVAIFVVTVALIVGSSSVTPLGEHVRGVDSVQNAGTDYGSVIDNIYQVVFVGAPIILMGGTVIAGIVYALRRERRVSRRRP